jgi:hypothetical protein
METTVKYLLETPHAHYEANNEHEFIATDSKELFDFNKKRIGPTWYWANNRITYKYNSEGYRMDKEIGDIDFDNYIAFFGCSYTVGSGLPITETFAYKIADKMKMDYVNASTVGATVEFVYNNLIELLSNAPTPPKHIVINWPELTRTMFWEEDKVVFMLPNMLHGVKNHWEKAYEAFVMEETHINQRFIMIRKAIKLLCQANNIALFELSSYQSDPEFYDKYTDIFRPEIERAQFNEPDKLHINKARDVSVTFIAHPGFLHQESIINEFLGTIK